MKHVLMCISREVVDGMHLIRESLNTLRDSIFYTHNYLLVIELYRTLS